MVWFRKAMILTHRYLGIALCLPIVVWFVSGIGMMYAGGMPRLTPETRLERLPPLELARVRLSPSEAAERGNMTPTPGRLVLTTIMNRPAYRFDRGSFSVVFADTGDVMPDVAAPEAMTVASRFMHLPEESLHPAGVLTEPDQWTIGQADQMPLHKFTVDDAAATQLYVSAPLGEVSVHTTRGTRALAWVAAIPHWMFLVELRRHGDLWRQLVMWTSGLAAISAVIGLVLAVTQFSPATPFRLNRLGASIPYVGLMRWHYITGAIFGLFTVTWLFSGMMSLEPFEWASGGGSGRGMRSALAGGELDVARFPRVDAAAWEEALRRVPRNGLAPDPGKAYYVARGVESKPVLVAANRCGYGGAVFDRVADGPRQAGNPGVPIVESQVLPDFDSITMSAARPRRCRSAGQVRRSTGRGSISIWNRPDCGTAHLASPAESLGVLRSAHLDFSFWYTSLGHRRHRAQHRWRSVGAIGMFIGFKRLKRNARRIAVRARGAGGGWAGRAGGLVGLVGERHVAGRRSSLIVASSGETTFS